MASRRSAGAQFRFSRIASVLIFTIGFVVSHTSAEPQSGHDQPDAIETENSTDNQARENPSRYTPSSFSDTTYSSRKRVTREFHDAYTLTPGVGVHKVHSDAEKWPQARKICQEEGGDLAIINSIAESLVIAQLIQNSYPHYNSEWREAAFVGFNDIDQKGHYVTIDGRSLDEAGFAQWAPGEPNNLKYEHCGSVQNNGLLNDLWCDRKFAFVCELPLLEEGSNAARGSHGVEGVMISLLCSLYLLARNY